MKILKIPDETFQFLAWLVRQDITLPNVIVYDLKWNRYAWKQIKAHLDILNEACIESAEEKEWIRPLFKEVFKQCVKELE